MLRNPYFLPFSHVNMNVCLWQGVISCCHPAAALKSCGGQRWFRGVETKSTFGLRILICCVATELRFETRARALVHQDKCESGQENMD